MLRIKRDDRVIIMAGKDKGKTGKVLRVIPAVQRVVVENINLLKKARRRTKQDQKGGIIEIECPIHISNVMLIDKKTNRPSRFGISTLKDGTKVRVIKRSGESI